MPLQLGRSWVVDDDEVLRWIDRGVELGKYVGWLVGGDN